MLKKSTRHFAVTSRELLITFSSLHAMKERWGSGGVTLLILNLSTRWRWEVSCPPWPLYPDKETPVHVFRKLGGLHFLARYFVAGTSVLLSAESTNRPARPLPTALLSPSSDDKREAATTVVAPDDGHGNARNMLSCMYTISNKLEKLLHLVGWLGWKYDDARIFKT
jgi:hypothetical protein